MTPPATIDELIDLLVALDGVFDAPPPLGDPVDILAHGLQCAEELRRSHPDDRELQLAGLVHDIGHALGEDPDHARTGGEAVRPLLGDRVAALVALHVQAKRYLAATEDYELSPASRLSLELQGAPMGSDEAAAFAAHPHAADAIVLRRADEAAKVVGREVPDLRSWTALLRHQAARSVAAQGDDVPGQGATE